MVNILFISSPYLQDPHGGQLLLPDELPLTDPVVKVCVLLSAHFHPTIICHLPFSLGVIQLSLRIGI